jgi:hypothetical protein
MEPFPIPLRTNEFTGRGTLTETVQTKMDALACFNSQIAPTQYDKTFNGLARPESYSVPH